MKLTVKYEGKVNSKLDKKLEAALKTMGFERWASGYNVLKGMRDIAFERLSSK